jgi:hypothetical protein
METLKRLFRAIAVSLGFGHSSEDRLSPDHGWLLPAPATVKARAPRPKVG